MIHRRALRSLVALAVVMVMVLGVWPWGMSIAKAEPTKYCDGTNGTHHFRLEDSERKIVHWCGPLNKEQSTGIIVEATTTGGVGGRKMGSPPDVSTGDTFPITAYDLNNIEFTLYEINIPTRSRKYFFAVHPQNPKRIVGGLWTNDRTVYDGLPFTNVLNARNFDYFQVNSSVSAVFAEENTAIKSYLAAMGARDSWSLVAQGSAGRDQCRPEYYQSPGGTKKYFPSRGTSAIGGVHWDEGTQPGANISGFIFGQSRAIRPSEPPVKINISGQTATVKIGGASGPEPGWNDVAINRPDITFTYKYFALYRDIPFSVDRNPYENNYFYFVSSDSGGGCSLALRFSDSVIRGKGEGAVTLVQATNLADSKLGLYDDENYQLASFKIDLESFDQFIRKLYDGKGLNEIHSDDKTVTEFGTEDELGGERVTNPQNVGTTSQEADPCNKRFSGPLNLIGRGLCQAGFAFAGLAAQFARVTLNWLISAAGLQ